MTALKLCLENSSKMQRYQRKVVVLMSRFCQFSFNTCC
jgi:hypothetical protein